VTNTLKRFRHNHIGAKCNETTIQHENASLPPARSGEVQEGLAPPGYGSCKVYIVGWGSGFGFYTKLNEQKTEYSCPKRFGKL
jgi:hypothetical protein